MFAHLCLLCDRSLTGPNTICRDCEEHLPWLPPGCERCGLRTGSLGPGRTIHEQCLQNPPAFDRCLGAFEYRAPINSLVASFKYRHRFAEAKALGRLLAATFTRHYNDNQLALPDCLVPVPLHHWRLRRRGFNQAIMLAQHIARHAGLPLDTRSIVRCRTAQSQKGQGREQRINSMRQMFTTSRRQRLGDVRHVAIVDDVVTTGATANALAQVLRDCGVQRIDVWCVARVIPAEHDDIS